MANVIDRGDLKLAHVNCSPSCGVASLAAFLPWLPVRSKVEGDEEDKVGAKDAASCDRSELFASTATTVGHPLKVG